MKSLLIFLFLLPSVALGQVKAPDLNDASGVNLSASQTITGAKTFSATILATHATKGLQIEDGSKICLNGSACTTSVQAFGNTLFLTNTATAAHSIVTGKLEAEQLTLATDTNAIVLSAGKRLCLNAGCTARIQEDGTGSAVDLYFSNALQMEFTSTIAYFLTGGLRFRGTISNDTAGEPVTYVDGEGVKVTRAALATCSANLEGTTAVDILSGSATGKVTKECLCVSNGSSVYTWRNKLTNTNGTSTTCGTE